MLENPMHIWCQKCYEQTTGKQEFSFRHLLEIKDKLLLSWRCKEINVNQIIQINVNMQLMISIMMKKMF